jgi:hypothetical protein
MANCNSFVTAFGTRAMRMRLLKQRQFSQIRTHLACTRIRRMALAASDDDQQKVKRIFGGTFTAVPPGGTLFSAISDPNITHRKTLSRSAIV